MDYSMKLFWIILGLTSIGIGTIGAMGGGIPPVPCYMLGIFFFAKSSAKLTGKFLNSRLYRENLESFTTDKALTAKAKAGVIIVVTIVLLICFVTMSGYTAGRAVIGIIWVGHIIYLFKAVKTIK